MTFSFQMVAFITVGSNGMLGTPLGKYHHYESSVLGNSALSTIYPTRLQRNGRKEGNTSTNGGQVRKYSWTCSFYAIILNQRQAKQELSLEAAVKELIIPGERNQRVDQLKWRTMVSRVRKKVKEAK